MPRSQRYKSTELHYLPRVPFKHSTRPHIPPLEWLVTLFSDRGTQPNINIPRQSSSG
jgi:hypothetical protein